MPDSAWFVGSLPIAAQSFTIDAYAASVAAGDYYLRSSTYSGDLIDALAAEMTSAGLALVSVQMMRSRQIRITASTTFAVTWGTATVLRDLLGFTQGNLSGASSYTAAGVSPLLWSPGSVATPATIQGVDGYVVDNFQQLKSEDGSQSQTVIFSEETWQDLEWSHVLPERMRVANGVDGGGTFHEWYEQCGKLGYRFLYYQTVFESDDAATSATWDDSSDNAFGPYVLRLDARGGKYYRRNVDFADVSSPMSLALHLVDEYA